jgi:hypothetical protein
MPEEKVLSNMKRASAALATVEDANAAEAVKFAKWWLDPTIPTKVKTFIGIGLTLLIILAIVNHFLPAATPARETKEKPLAVEATPVPAPAAPVAVTPPPPSAETPAAPVGAAPGVPTVAAAAPGTAVFPSARNARNV